MFVFVGVGVVRNILAKLRLTIIAITLYNMLELT